MSGSLKVLIAAHIKWYNAEAEYVHRLARGLMNRGHLAMVWARPASPLALRLRQEGLPVVEAGDTGSLDPAKIVSMHKFVRDLITEGGFHLLNAHRSEGFPVIARAASKARAPVVRTRAESRMPRLLPVNRRVHKWWSDWIITSSERLREELVIRLGIEEERTRVIRFGIGNNELKPGWSRERARKELGISDGERVAAVAARFQPVKGHEFFLKAAEEVANRFPRSRFLLLYKSIEPSDIFMPMLKRSPLRDRFILVGPRNDHVNYMQAADVAVIPSVGSEAHCRVALEWMALRIPVIGSRVGVIPEIIEHGDTGFLVQPRYSEAMAECIMRLFEDPELAERMGQAGRQRLEAEFSEERMIEENLEVFRKAVRLA